MEATKVGTAQGQNHKYLDMELVGCMQIFSLDTAEVVVKATFNMNRYRHTGQPVYCNLQVRENSGFESGNGKADGVGYHKKSAALEAAIESAGYKLSEEIGGVGYDEMVVALHVLAIKNGYNNIFFNEV